MNKLGSVFYGPILGIFMVGFFLRKIGGTATFVAAILAEVGVILCFWLTDIAYLWYNVIGCMLLIVIALAINPFFRSPRDCVARPRQRTRMAISTAP